MKLVHLEEAELEFGHGGRHIDIRFGVMNFGPLDVASDVAPKKILVGIVGTPSSVEGVHEWLETCRGEVAAKESRQPNLFPRFPGFNAGTGFRSEVGSEPRMRRTIPDKIFDPGGGTAAARISGAVDAVIDELQFLSSETPARVHIVAVPQQLIELGESQEGASAPDFHDLLKARVMRLKRDVPIQLIAPRTYDPSQRRRRRKNKEELRRLQDDATIAWNFFGALYYKAGGAPWRMIREWADLSTCFIGVSFYQTLDRRSLLTSVAQVFNERGDGLIVRGGQVQLDKVDRQPRLSGEDARRLLENALMAYRKEHGQFPARIVLHKTSSHSSAEIEGFREAAGAAHVDHVDLVSISSTSGVRLLRQGTYPPLRGTLLSLDAEHHMLYSRGSVDFFATYPGMYVPVPLLVRCDAVEQTPKALAREMLALSKMNWNKTQFDGREPITLEAARRVGGILKYLEADDPVATSYRSYM
ncbi:MAG TPA: hypothetical protein VFA20_08605 [Myxococcaceae bacterium]|nr:hypothetical protein [Myxococcaceae bacterium]